MVCKQTSAASGERESPSTVREDGFCYTGVTQWFMKCQTLLPLKNSGLHICLSCLFQLSWWHAVPPPHPLRKPCNGSVGLVANEWRVVTPLLRRETKLCMRNQGREGKWVTVLCHCGVPFSTPGKAARAVLTVQGRQEAGLQRWLLFWPSRNENALTSLSFLKIIFQVKML